LAASLIKVYQTDGNANDDPWTQINDELQHILNDNSAFMSLSTLFFTLVTYAIHEVTHVTAPLSRRR